MTGPALTTAPQGEGKVETYTVKYGRSGATGVIIGRLPDGSRFLATTAPGDNASVAALVADDAFGRTVDVTGDGKHNIASVR